MRHIADNAVAATVAVAVAVAVASAPRLVRRRLSTKCNYRAFSLLLLHL